MRGIFEKLAHLLARWQTKLKNWLAVWHIDTFIGTLVRKNEKLACYWCIGTQARWHINHTGTQACRQVNHTGTQARWHVDHVGTQAHMEI